MWSALVAAALSVAPADEDMRIPVIAGVAGPADMRVPIGDSVRAATWDDLAIKPDQPKHMRLACIIFVPAGAPGGCVPASLIAPGQTMIDWPEVMMAADAAYAGRPADMALIDAATQRIGAARVVARDTGDALFAVRFFDEIIAPADARPPFAETDDGALTTRDAVFAEPLDAELMALLYPMIAMRYAVDAEVRVTCRIEPDLKLLCRDRGVVVFDPGKVGSYAAKLEDDLRFSTYQLASTIRLEPKSADGRDVAGRSFRFVVRWSMPGE